MQEEIERLQAKSALRKQRPRTTKRRSPSRIEPDIAKAKTNQK